MHAKAITSTSQYLLQAPRGEILATENLKDTKQTRRPCYMDKERRRSCATRADLALFHPKVLALGQLDALSSPCVLQPLRADTRRVLVPPEGEILRLGLQNQACCGSHLAKMAPGEKRLVQGPVGA